MKNHILASTDFVTVSELARHFRVTPAHVYRLIQRGDLPAFKVGARKIVRLDDAEAFLRNGATMHTPEAE